MLLREVIQLYRDDNKKHTYIQWERLACFYC